MKVIRIATIEITKVINMDEHHRMTEDEIREREKRFERMLDADDVHIDMQDFIIEDDAEVANDEDN